MSEKNPTTELKKITLEDIFNHADLTKWLNQKDLKAIVTTTGNYYVAAGALKGRFRVYFEQTLKRLGLNPRLFEVADFDLNNWFDTHQTKNAQEQLQDKKEANTDMAHILGQAIKQNASDIYLDIGAENAELSFRVFGGKRHQDILSAENATSIVRSMWAQANTGSFEAKNPCDCAFPFDFLGRKYRIRCNSVPDVRGPHIVCRVRDPEYILPLSESGYSAHQIATIEQICSVPGGLIIISGETNSGKSTTLASFMSWLPTTQKVIEIADPVELILKGITHIELNRYHEDAAEIFNRIQAAIVRQNPDTLVLGEIRDSITASAATSMAIQGKRVYSTLHAPSCNASIPRLETLGINSDLLQLREFLAGIINQNLVPLICKKCAHDMPIALTKTARKNVFKNHPELTQSFRYINPEGCEHCIEGITGQTLVAEVYPLGLDRSGEAQQLIAQKNYGGLGQYMVKKFNLQTKHQHAAQKVIDGQIPLIETERIIGAFSEEDLDGLSRTKSGIIKFAQPATN